MGRPKVPLIDRDVAVAKALEIIDAHGLDAFSIRNLGRELGINGASLYHHFADKDAILDGVRLLIMREARVIFPQSASATWQDYARRSATGYRKALLGHPNAAPLMMPANGRHRTLVARDQLVQKMAEAGVPLHLAYPIMESVETLSLGSAMANPYRLTPDALSELRPGNDLPALEKALRASVHRSADRLFKLQLDALLAGWTTVIADASGLLDEPVAEGA